MKHYKTGCNKSELFKGRTLNECNDCGAFELTNSFKGVLRQPNPKKYKVNTRQTNSYNQAIIWQNERGNNVQIVTNY